MSLYKINQALRGFSLLEAALLLAIVGVLSGGILHFLRYIERSFQHKKAHEHEERILFALGQYLRREGCMPCPADPSDIGRFGYARSRCQGAKQAYGIVPFETLGLSENVARNGHGAFFTYVVHPSVTLKNTLSPQGQHPFCVKKVQPIFSVVEGDVLKPDIPKDPIIMVLLSPMKSGGSFVRGQPMRRPYAKTSPGRQVCNACDFKIHLSTGKNGMCQENARIERQSNFRTYYAHIFCDS